MNTKQLKQKILSLAISGRLVPQDPTDEPASELLKRIRAEKARLIKEGKLKKDKNETVIFRGDDNKFYQQKGKTVIRIEDRLPFSIPGTWEWVKLGQIADFKLGKTPARSEAAFWDDGIFNWVSISDMEDYGHVKTSKEKVSVAAKALMGDLSPVGALIMSFKLTIGRTSILDIPAFHNEAIISIFPYADKNSVLRNYLFYILPLMSNYGNANNAVKGKTLNKSSIGALPIPLPPLAEQKRIAKEVERWFAKIDQLEHDCEALSKFGKQVRKKLLAAAIAGHLVSQDPKDEPASEFLHRINPRATLIQGNVPFDVPGNWAWCRLGNICDIARGGSPRPIKKYLTGAENGVNWIKIGDTKPDDKYVRSVKQKIKPEGVSRSRFVHKGDFLLTNSMSFGRPYILDVDGCIHDGWLVISPKGGVYDKDFLYYLLSSPFAYEQFSRKAGGGVVDNLNSEKVSNTVFPLPPLAEQKRIVEKLESMFAVLDKLEVSCN